MILLRASQVMLRVGLPPLPVVAACPMWRQLSPQVLGGEVSLQRPAPEAQGPRLMDVSGEVIEVLKEDVEHVADLLAKQGPGFQTLPYGSKNPTTNLKWMLVGFDIESDPHFCSGCNINRKTTKSPKELQPLHSVPTATCTTPSPTIQAPSSGWRRSCCRRRSTRWTSGHCPGAGGWQSRSL